MKHQETWKKITQVILHYRKGKFRNYNLVQEEKQKKKTINSQILIVIVMTYIHIMFQESRKPYTISKFGNSENSGGRYPDKLLLSRRLQVQSWRWSLISQIVLTDETYIQEYNQLTSEQDLVIWIAQVGFDHWLNCCSCDCSQGKKYKI